MNNKLFTGWKDVLIFTLKQQFSQKYKMITIILAMILFACGFAVNIFSAMGQKKDDNISPVEKVYVIDESEIGDINWSDSKQLDEKQFPKVTFELTDSDVQSLGIKIKDNETGSVIVKLTKAKDYYTISVYIPSGSIVTKDDGENLAKAIKSIVNEGLINASAIDADKVTYVVSGIKTDFSTVGENAKSESLMLLTSVFPFVFMFAIYFLVIIYGQNMGHIVCIEKSSKLMESLLVMTRPYALIFGKIIATAFSAILQMTIWIVALIVGFIVGDGFAKNTVYSNYNNTILLLFKDLSMDESTKAFTLEAIILTVIAVGLAFLFYCMLAGAIASFASKADELGTVMMFYNMALVIGFLGAYILPNMSGQEWVKVLIRIVPVASAFILPGEILLGTVKTGMAVVYLLILAVWIILTAVFAGKVYENQVFYKGKSLKDRLPWTKSKQDNDDEQWVLLHDEAGQPLEGSQKIGYFFLAISPLALFFVIQILGSLVLTNIMTRIDLRGIDLDTWEVKDFVDYYRGIESTLNPMTVMICHLLIISTFGLWMYFIRRGADRNNILHVKSLLGRKVYAIIGICVVCGIGLCVLANGTVVIENELTPSIVRNYMEMAESAGFGTSPFAIIAAVCMAPIGEEFLCRGISLHFGKKALGKFWYANILQALLFGILHMNWVQGIYAFIIGLVLGILVERFDSLLPSILVHFIVNLSSSTWVPKVLGDVELSLSTGIIMVVLPGIIVVAILYLTGRDKAKV